MSLNARTAAPVRVGGKQAVATPVSGLTVPRSHLVASSAQAPKAAASAFKVRNRDWHLPGCAPSLCARFALRRYVISSQVGKAVVGKVGRSARLNVCAAAAVNTGGSEFP
jgi:hypothetical protein